MVGKVYVSMGDTSVKNSRIKIQKPHAYLHIRGKKSTKFHVNPMKDVRGVAEIRTLGRTEERTKGQTDGRNSESTDERGSFL